MITEEVKCALQIVAEIDLSVFIHYKLVLPEVEQKYGANRKDLVKVVSKMIRERLLRVVYSEYLALSTKFEKMSMYDLIHHIDGDVKIPEWYVQNWKQSVTIEESLRFVTVMDVIQTGAVFKPRPLTLRGEQSQYDYLCRVLPKDDEGWNANYEQPREMDQKEVNDHRISLIERVARLKRERDDRMAVANELARLLEQRNNQQ